MSTSNAPVAKFCFAQEDDDGEFVHLSFDTELKSVNLKVTPDEILRMSENFVRCIAQCYTRQVSRLSGALDDVAQTAWEKCERDE